ncbi:suppressor of glycerol defect [Malassezia vespertilionis]|uniref:Sgd1p n=1 Tax=Malassezia vespertilionis TaxID=2020962 RepID=A0A2N1JGG6_9BASI|nr:suppressor of glycerol defect [Malassezia vespertilionis]PKI85642.1 Sgd1p [Malassezia vespertilionis]WFD05205.1 suppressor of glycerol defect [Malassezia vespertilionis]
MKSSYDREKKQSKLERLAGEKQDEGDFKRKRVLSAVEKEEENEIAWLEHKLGGKRKKQSEGDDLDFLLDDLDRFQPGEDEESTNLSDSDASAVYSEDELQGSDEYDDEDEEEEDVEEAMADDFEQKAPIEAVAHAEQPKASAPPSGMYVPPALRAAKAKERDAEKEIEQQKLHRYVNRQLNRLAEGNLDTIIGELDSLYRTFARRDVSTTITRLVLDTIAARTHLTETIVVLYAALITAMHRIVGVEFGAYFLQECITRMLHVYVPLIKTPLDETEEVAAKNRECVNLMLLLCHLFNLKLISSTILYDLVRLFLNRGFRELLPGINGPKVITEADIELILRIVQSSGADLRRDDSTSFKAIAELTSEVLAQAPKEGNTVANSSRARFMLEALVNVRKNHKQNQSATMESTQRMTKFLSTLERRRSVRTQAALQVGLKDLQDAEKKGRWWLVGAAWTGHEETSDSAAPTTKATQESNTDLSWLPDDTKEETACDFVALGRSHGMNTDARRAIFSTLLNSVDYKDAVQSLMQLKLNEVQRREVIRVLLHCGVQEQQYNPFYTLVGQQLAEELPAMRVTLQYVLWDYFREIGETHVGGEKITAHAQDDDEMDTVDDEVRQRKLLYFARAYGWWFGRGSLSLSALKSVDFTSLHARGIHFLQQLFLQTFLSCLSKSPILTAKSRQHFAASPSQQEKETIEKLVVRGTVGNPTLAQGFLFFFKAHLGRAKLAELVGDDAVVFVRLKWAISIATETASVGVQAAGDAAL